MHAAHIRHNQRPTCPTGRQPAEQHATSHFRRVKVIRKTRADVNIRQFDKPMHSNRPSQPYGGC